MAFSDPVDTDSSGLRLVNGVLWGMQWSDGSPANTRIAVHIAGTGGTAEKFDFGGDIVTAKTAAPEVAAFQLTLELFSNVCNLEFTEVATSGAADINVGTVGNADAQGALGTSVPPGEDTGPLVNQQGGAIVNHAAYFTDDFSSLEQGGYDFISFIHEFGHAVGLKHPHDTGGGVFPKFPGVTGPFDSYGDFDLNQGLYSMMSYNDGFPTGPLGEQSPEDTPGYGWEGTPMAFDIAALQHMYGANTAFHTGDEVYTLPSVNASGTFFSCIWDAGGTDEIAAGGNGDCTIDLRSATLRIEVGGGGFLSSHEGILGGFTIANGAVIENATGGNGDDVLRGNEVANELDGSEGEDTLRGAEGADVLTGGGDGDSFVFDKASDSTRKASDEITDFLSGSDLIVLGFDADTTTGAFDAFTFIGDEGFSGNAGELRFHEKTAAGTTLIFGDLDGDGKADFRIVADGLIAFAESDFLI